MDGTVASRVPVVSHGNVTKYAVTPMSYCVPAHAHAASVILDGKPANALVTAIDGDSDRAGTLGSSLAGKCPYSSVTHLADVLIVHTHA